MGRGRGSRGGRRSYSIGSGWPKNYSLPSLRKKSSPKPAKTKDENAPPPEKLESKSGGFMSSIADGFGFGTGNAMGHRFVEAIFGPRTIRQEIVLPEKVKEVDAVSANDDNEKLKEHTESCRISYNAFQDCLNMEGNNLRKCQLFMDSLFECRRNSSSYNF